MPFIAHIYTSKESLTSAFLGGWTLGEDTAEMEHRVGVMFIILFISLFAVSFPGISKHVAFLRIPHILFFIGKHFGTGVILATAFIHLLSDAFDSLQKRVVKDHYHNIGKWTGLIILVSFLGIFLVEYISTTYVDHLHAEPSAPPTPARSPPSSRPRSRTRSPGPRASFRSPPATSIAPPAITKSTESSPPERSNITEDTVPVMPVVPVTERTPLIAPPLNRSVASAPIPTGLPRAQSLSHLPRHLYHGHHHNTVHPHLPPSAALIPIDILTNSPRLIRAGQGICSCGGNGGAEGKDWNRERGRSGAPGVDDVEEESREIPIEREPPTRVGRRRQVVGILVLQLGIMIHSFVIGLTLAITSGADFTSLTTAIIFHQLFEGLSLGIRIAALPAEPLATPLALPSQHPSPKQPDYPRRWWSSSRLHVPALWKEFNWLKFTLSVLFAITTPLGMGIGLLAFPSSGSGSNEEMAHMYLTQGLMSAISAGMLIYASAVEMIAGDFVFGDVEGHTHSHGGHSLEAPGHSYSPSHSPSPTHGGRRHDSDVDDVEEEVEEEDGGYTHGKIRKKVVAVASLLAGVGGMVLVGLAE